MTEARVGFLYNIAAAVAKPQNNETHEILRSYYLMRCKNITRGYGLPDKHFSAKVRCRKCCIQWTNNTEVKVRPIKLSRRQKQRLKSKKIVNNRKEYVRKRKDLLISNEVEQICSFCKNSTITTVLKPQKQALLTQTKIDEKASTNEPSIPQISNKKAKADAKKKVEVNVYANAMDVFSLQNKNNTLASTIKEKPKVISNNKKKKDKFAGLCQKAVLASAKLKEQNKKQNSLNLFLKPSSTQ
ncbi:uncharacterized protein LOC142983440 [Anticarsia gemmatalis]|uniref:uncharacterized protein LOC142983440 n=1 Tax=Anticarsia gemmatalis TaxID=129554 RepID=UPI003F7747E6